MKQLHSVVVLSAFSLAVVAAAASVPAQHPEDAAAAKNKIEWLHPLDAALPTAGKDARPIILYFTFDT
ncbi:MAG: hypothetical protein ACYTGW_22715 [Planctomycetota bacterium]|jgi:hypothetical protein